MGSIIEIAILIIGFIIGIYILYSHFFLKRIKSDPWIRNEKSNKKSYFKLFFTIVILGVLVISYFFNGENNNIAIIQPFITITAIASLFGLSKMKM